MMPLFNQNDGMSGDPYRVQRHSVGLFGGPRRTYDPNTMTGLPHPGQAFGFLAGARPQGPIGTAPMGEGLPGQVNRWTQNPGGPGPAPSGEGLPAMGNGYPPRGIPLTRAMGPGITDFEPRPQFQDNPMPPPQPMGPLDFRRSAPMNFEPYQGSGLSDSGQVFPWTPNPGGIGTAPQGERPPFMGLPRHPLFQRF